MPAMKSVQTGTTPGAIEAVELERPVPGPNDVLVRVRACGICGTDVTFLHMGGGPFGPGGQMTAVSLGHERRREGRHPQHRWG
jgi:threonine dehydrogenase-like Zn-dependent dehydrogenase